MFNSPNKAFVRNVYKKLRALRKHDCNSNHQLGLPFTKAELTAALKNLQPRKAPGPDGIPNEFLMKPGEVMMEWFLSFVNACLLHNHIPKMWRRASIIAILKPGKLDSNPESYRPISLLCSSFKLFERLILNRINPIIDPLLPPEQAGFRKGKSTVDQVCRLTQNIEQAFHDRHVAGSVFIDLKAAYDTVWHKGLHLKLSELLQCSKMSNLIMNLLHCRSFILDTNDGQSSRSFNLKNGVAEGSVLAPTLSNVYTSDFSEI